MEKMFGWDNSDFSVDDLSELTRPLFGDLEGFQFDLNLYSMSNYSEVFTQLARVAAPRNIAEIGVYRGKFSRHLLSSFANCCENFDFIDVMFSPTAREDVHALALKVEVEHHFFEERSSDYLRRERPVDWVFVDGDHNYETVSEELTLMGAAQLGPRIICCHDTGWPCARWETAYDPAQLAAAEAYKEGMVSPFSANAVDDFGLGLPFIKDSESREKSGVLTAVEDFLLAHDHYSHLKFSPFFGLSILWDRRQFNSAENSDIEALGSDSSIYAALINKLELNRIMLLISLQRAGRVWKKQKDYIAKLQDKLKRKED